MGFPWEKSETGIPIPNGNTHSRCRPVVSVAAHLAVSILFLNYTVSVPTPMGFPWEKWETGIPIPDADLSFVCAIIVAVELFLLMTGSV